MGFAEGSIGDKLASQLANDIGTSKAARVIIPVTHIYLEHAMTLLIMKKSDKGENLVGKNKKSSFLEKAKILYALHEFNDDEYNELRKLNTIRNQFAHNFNPDEKETIKLGLELKFHPYNEKRPIWNMYIDSGIEILSRIDTKLGN